METPNPITPDNDYRGLEPGGPTHRQELFLRRQRLWDDDLTKDQATQLIGDFLTEKQQQRLRRQQERQSAATTPCTPALDANV